MDNSAIGFLRYVYQLKNDSPCLSSNSFGLKPTREAQKPLVDLIKPYLGLCRSPTHVVSPRLTQLLTIWTRTAIIHIIASWYQNSRTNCPEDTLISIVSDVILKAIPLTTCNEPSPLPFFLTSGYLNGRQSRSSTDHPIWWSKRESSLPQNIELS